MAEVDVLFLCTGNAARSVMAGAALAARRTDLRVATAGTFSLDGQPMSWRTREALRSVGLEPPQHRSRQATAVDLDGAELVVALAPEHVQWIRRQHPAAAARTGTLKRLCRDLPATAGPLPDRVRSLGLGWVELEPWEEVVDPGGGEIEDFQLCAREIVGLIDQLASILDPPDA